MEYAIDSQREEPLHSACNQAPARQRASGHEPNGVPLWARLAPSTGREFVMAMPVPNITGTLHIGHALDLSLQDVVVRHRAQNGDAVYFPAGTDHAGLNAQWVAERELQRSGRTRQSLGRAAFETYMLEWKDRHQRLIFDQMRRLGILASFEPHVHSLDTRRRELCEAAFRRMSEQGLVYRERALVNWCSECGTCVGAQELERRECLQTLFKVRVEAHGISLELGTLHLELMLGATAFGLPRTHPQFANLIGKWLPLPGLDKQLRVVEVPAGTRLDDYLTLVLPGYNAHHFDEATGAGAAIPEIYDERGLIAAAHAEFAGLDPKVCQASLERRLRECAALVGREPYLQGDAYHRLCGGLVRPRPTQAWFVRSAPFNAAAKALLEEQPVYCNDPAWDAAVRAALETLAGARAESGNRWWEGACLAVVQDFSSNRDWIISRQNWWGYQIPAWHCSGCSAIHAGEECPRRCSGCGLSEFQRDSDVFDVLFHSALWGLLVSEDPEREPHADCAGLGADVLEFWLATAQVWSQALYGRRSIGRALVHGLICGEDGRKLSKSLGNALDLSDILDRHSIDGVRAALFGAMCGRDGSEQIPLHEGALVEGDSWAARLFESLQTLPLCARSSEPRHQQLDRAVRQIGESLEQCRVGAAYALLLELVEGLLGTGAELDEEDFWKLLRALYPFHPGLTERVALRRISEAAAS